MATTSSHTSQLAFVLAAVIMLGAACTSTSIVQAVQPATGDLVVVDAEAAGHPISPLVYGVSNAGPGDLTSLGATLNRWGGNPMSRYNWVNGHAWNAARDYQFRNGNYGESGSAADKMIQQALASSATPLITIPTLGWVAKNDDNQLHSVNVPGQGGSPISQGSSAIKGYDPTANRQVTSIPSMARKPGPFVNAPPGDSQVVYQDEWVNHIVTTFGSGAHGVRYFAMDNEPDLWSITHTDVHPVEMSYASMLSNFEQYSTAVKAVDPNALVLGPVVSGWTGYMFSALDAGTDNYATHADRQAHGDTPFLPWWLSQVAKADKASGSRSLDLLDVHFYPQAQGVYSDAHDAQTSALRIRSVHSLYDPNYVDESWIGQPIALIPRLKGWIAANYAGTGLAITEYNWGGEKDASGAVALAEVLGIFGREGVDVASYWSFPPSDSPAGAAFRLYRNYDGKGGVFGDLSLPVTVTAAGVAAFAARDSRDGTTDVMLVNESLTQTTQVKLSLKGSLTDHAEEYLLVGGSSTIAHSAVANLAQPISLPPLSVALIRVAQG